MKDLISTRKQPFCSMAKDIHTIANSKTFMSFTLLLKFNHIVVILDYFHDRLNTNSTELLSGANDCVESYRFVGKRYTSQCRNLWVDNNFWFTHWDLPDMNISNSFVDLLYKPQTKDVCGEDRKKVKQSIVIWWS
jgi:hypothetical protein